MFLPHSMYMLRGPAQGGCACLTFDDGPHPEHTPRILDALKQAGAQATFFVIGRNAERYPDLVRRMIHEGHGIGNHTFTHAEPAETSSRQLIEEMRHTEEVLAAIARPTPRLFRPPKGKLTAAKVWRLWRSKQTIVLWNIDPRDYACGSKGDIEGWFEKHPLKSGDLVLLHDTQPHTAAALPGLLDRWSREGLRFVTVAHWLKRTEYV
jgi:peptidoglycan/xylan/chitin deacetylase (PgdA/CDA1 family)